MIKRFLKSKTFWFTAISLVVVVLIFRYLFQHISPRDVIEVIRNVDRQALVVFLLLSLSMSIFRTWRYKLLLNLSGHNPPLFSLFLTVLARNCTSDLLPARIGTLSYIFIITTRLGIPIGSATSSFALAMLLDIVGLAPLILLAALFAGAQNLIPTWSLFVGSIALATIPLLALYSFKFLIDKINLYIEKFKLFSETKRKSLISTLIQIKEDLRQTEKAKIFTPLLILSVLIRVSKYAALYFFLYGLLVAFGYTLADLNPAKAFLAICASELSASLPISGIAGFGLYQGTWSVVFEFMGFPGDIAKLTSISHHLFTQAYGYSLGLIAFLILLLPFLKTESFKSTNHFENFKPVQFYSYSISLVTLILLIITSILNSDANAQKIKPADQRNSVEILNNSLPAGTKIPNFSERIVFDSNRSGTFGIYILEPKTLAIKELIDTQQHEMYPDVSPDGKLVAYSVAVSTSRLSPSQIWIHNLNSGENTLLNNDGVAPQFSSDGKTIFFERNRRRVIAIDLDGSNEREIFPLDRKSMKGFQVVKPRVSPDGKYVAFSSDKKGAWNAWVADLTSRKLIHIGKGCEPTWMADQEKIMWIIKAGARQESGIFARKLEDDHVIEVQDAGEPLGHEYFPYASRNGKWILYSAAPPGHHSHITDKYSLMAKNLDSGTVFQLTFDDFTNRWPKFITD